MMFNKKSTIVCVAAATLVIGFALPALAAPIVTINSKDFDLAQFSNASVTYRSDGSVDFDGKQWDNQVGVDGYSLGELAAGQYGSDPGDQVSLNDRNTPDWLQLNYGAGLILSASNTEFVVFEITSSTNGVDPEGLSWKIGFNGDAPIAVTSGQVSYFANPTPSAEDTNMAVFNLQDFGLNPGDTLFSVRIENLDSGSGTSDPDFIFAGVTVPEPASIGLIAIGGLALLRRRRHA
jgi:hypothetical protein